MDEGEAIALLMAFWAVLAYAAFQRIFVVRPLRKQVRKLELENARMTAAHVQAVAPEQDEFHRINERLQVLERIAVEKENSLSKEIDGLRAAG
jgi:hypothetical protein